MTEPRHTPLRLLDVVADALPALVVDVGLSRVVRSPGAALFTVAVQQMAQEPASKPQVRVHIVEALWRTAVAKTSCCGEQQLHQSRTGVAEVQLVSVGLGTNVTLLFDYRGRHDGVYSTTFSLRNYGAEDVGSRHW
ncbi:MAG: hypothetical protein AVDCRST_MAG77-2052 [uncultured Chloroflexi bacterium]|uniref:Uncharacterized protein n=1 Tax=uncultured Chloroflexota bacterium TaxID=166587 RepID=A0A6J4IEM4_9CHLR|nr:MAG: hypothetical protein AVDCRST_MAG77-2052 [uncultured Chloroflexota bacterium]